MKKTILLSLLCMILVSYNASASNYRIDDSAIESVFASTKVITENFATVGNLFDVTINKANLEEKNVWIAVLLDFFLGGLAVHRVYLGGTPMLIVGYLLTCGGIFGIVPLIDLIVLVINSDDISKYVNNNKFFMW
jgi:TM2 domain-containing membrane protein YozV